MSQEKEASSSTSNRNQVDPRIQIYKRVNCTEKHEPYSPMNSDVTLAFSNFPPCPMRQEITREGPYKKS